MSKLVTQERLNQFAQEAGVVYDGRYLKQANIATYAVEKQATAETGYIATYVLKKTENGTATEVGDKINIPKDYLVKNVSIEVCEAADDPIAGLVVGDKYIDFTVNTVEGTGNESHLYIAINDIIHPITGSAAITVSATNEIGLKAVEANGLSIDATNGLTLAIAASASGTDAATAGAMSGTDKAKLDTYPATYEEVTQAEVTAIVSGMFSA